MDRLKRNTLAGLPDEAMLEILARVPFRSICRSKCVAKAWRDLIDDPHNRGRLPQTLQGFFSIFHRRGNLEHFFVKYSASSVPLDIDPCFSFLTKLPEIEGLHLFDSCNGLFLFRHFLKSNILDVLGYIVCNPTTKHWATVPVCACYPPSKALLDTNLAFDPAVSPHFHLIQFWKGCCDEDFMMSVLSVHTYSSETGVWSHSQTDWNEQGQMEGWCREGIINYGSIFVNGILHLIVSAQSQHQIVAVDVQGMTKRTIKMPAVANRRNCDSIPCIGQSQGRLHYINLDFLHSDPGYSTQVDKLQSSELSIWELQDYDAQEWVLKDTVSLFRLFGRMTDGWRDTIIIDIHPDRSVVFIHITQPLNRIIAYDMDSKEVSVFATLSENWMSFVPYIPYFSESPALTNKN